MIPDPYTQLAHHLHALGIGYPLKDDLMDLVFTHMSSTGYEDRRFFTAESAEHAENGCFPICSAPSACSAVRCGQSPGQPT